MDADEADLLVARSDDVLILTLNRPRARNTVSFSMWERFSQALDAAESGTPPRAVVIAGAENYFGNGGDVKTPPARGDGALRLAARLELGQRVIARLRALPAPTIAAVEGGAFGISFALAMACDLLFTSDTAKFGAPFVEYGLVPDGGAAWFLTRRLGRARAAELLFSGRSIDAAEAHALGLVSRLLPAGTVVDAATEFARGIGHGNVQAVELTKRLLHVAESSDLAAAHALELVYCHVGQGGDEAIRAREAFAARSAARRKAAEG